MKCPYCEAEISDTARKCRHCGEWVTSPSQPQSTPQAPPAAQPVSHHVSVNVPAQQQPASKQGSATFAVITLVLYFFFFPLAALLNLIGIFTGPKRGCFLSMLLVFIVLPAAVIFLIFMTNPDVWEEFWREFDKAFREASQNP